MIVEALITLCVAVLSGLFSLIEVSGLSLLVDAVGALTTFAVFGSYVVGSDLLLVFGGMVAAWAAAKISVGIGIRLWELLPFT